MSGLALGASATIGAGFIPTKSGRVWDTYLRGIRAVEAGSPGGVLRTFRTSEFLSPLESWNDVSALPADIKRGIYGKYLKSTFGEATGFNLKRTGHIFGEVRDSTGNLLGMGLQIEAGSQKGTAIADFAARLQGIQLGPLESLNDAILRNKWEQSKTSLSYVDWLDTIEPHTRRQRLIIGSKIRNKIRIAGQDLELSESMAKNLAKIETGGKLLRAKAATTANRLNILLRAPVELPGIKQVAEKMGFRSLAVQQGSNLDLLRRYTGKGLIIGAAWKGLEYTDYLRSEGNPWATVLAAGGGSVAGGLLASKPGMKFSKSGLIAGAAIGLITGIAPRFEHGIFHGTASIAADVSIAKAQLSRTMGFTDTIKEQEQITPGYMSPKTALAFGGVGGLIGGVSSYASFIGKSVYEKTGTKTPMSHVFESVRKQTSTSFADSLWESGIGKKIAGLPGGKFLSKIKSPAVLGAIAGIAAWGISATALGILSGNPTAPLAGILGTAETPEELSDIYSGRKEVAIRKGRWWEFGRCLLQDTEIVTGFGISKQAKNIKIKDKLLSSDGFFCDVLNIWKRSYSGLSYSIYSVLDKNTPTKITWNHTVPILTKENTYSFEIVEKKAKDIKVGEYVQIPIPKLKEDTLIIETEELIKTGLYLLDKENILPAQLNWYSKKTQKSRGFSIPRIINLTPELGRLFGYFLAEGNLSFKNKTPHIIETVHAKSEKWIVDDIVSICEKELNITPTVRFKDTGKKTKEGCWIVRICSSLLARVYFELFYKSNRKQDKIFPPIFMSTPKDFKKQLIEGYWRGDGHLEKNTKILSSCRKDLLLKTQTILLSLGFYPTIDSLELNGHRGRYKIRWHQFAKFEGRGCHGLFKWFNNKLFAKIQKIKIKEYNDSVYDFEIDHPDHLFVAGTFLVHNSSAFEGGRVDYYRPHMIARLKSRAYQKGMYGSEQEKWDYDPMLNPVKALFGSDDWKYHYEQKYQYSRPAPTTGTYGEDIPFIGPLVAATFGKLFKPRKLVREDEWNLGGGQYVHHKDPRGETEPSYALGGLQEGAPVAKESATQLLNELNYKRREAVGLVGFVEGSMTKAAIGREEFFENQQTLGAMGKETGAEYWLWKHMNLGGGGGTTEVVRRFIPRTRSYLESYNPLRNDMPSWMPEDYFLDLRTGNPFDKIPEAELRLPGEGYAALHPELEGVAAEEYPLSHRVKILGDVAMWSSEYRNALSKAKRNLNNLSIQEVAMVRETEKQVQQRKKRREFQEYSFNPDELTESQVTVSEIISPRRFKTKEYGDMMIEMPGIGAIKDTEGALSYARDTLLGQKVTLYSSSLESQRLRMSSSGAVMKAAPMVDGVDYGLALSNQGFAEEKELKDEFKQIRFSSTQQLAGQLGQYITHGIESPLEYLTPVSPASKLIRQRSAVEEYVASEAIGTASSFWDKPIENFLKPAANMTMYKAGDTSIPAEIQQRRDIQEYFDMLSWTKSSRLEAKSRQEGDLSSAAKYRMAKSKTVFGVDVFKSPTNIMRALPRRERDFFGEFINAKSEEERRDILSLIPENERRVYLSQWMRQEESAAYAKKSVKINDEQDNQVIAATALMRKGEGFSYTNDQEEQWMNETGGQIEFDEWLREQKAQEYFSTHSLPGADWLGWHPSVDMEDVKMQYVEQAGLDHHDFDLWGQRKRALARKSYINPSLVNEMSEAAEYEDSWKVAENSKALSDMFAQHKAEVYMSKLEAHEGKDRYNIQVTDGRKELINKAYKELGA